MLLQFDEFIEKILKILISLRFQIFTKSLPSKHVGRPCLLYQTSLNLDKLLIKEGGYAFPQTYLTPEFSTVLGLKGIFNLVFETCRNIPSQSISG